MNITETYRLWRKLSDNVNYLQSSLDEDRNDDLLEIQGKKSFRLESRRRVSHGMVARPVIEAYPHLKLFFPLLSRSTLVWFASLLECNLAFRR